MVLAACISASTMEYLYKKSYLKLSEKLTMETFFKNMVHQYGILQLFLLCITSSGVGCLASGDRKSLYLVEISTEKEACLCVGVCVHIIKRRFKRTIL